MYNVLGRTTSNLNNLSSLFILGVFFMLFLMLVVGGLVALIVLTVKKHMDSDYYKQTGKNIFELGVDKGASGEFKIGLNLERVSGYKKIIYNCYIPKNNNETTEIDVIMIHEKGIYVVESKNYSGWIFGNEDRPQWTQVLRSGRRGSQKHHFYNPIMQNKTHVKWLKSFLEPTGADITMFSCIVFGDSCVFKDITITSHQHALMYASQLYRSVQNHIDSSYCRLTADQIDDIYNRLFPLTQKCETEKLQHIYNVVSHKETRSTYVDHQKNTVNDLYVAPNLNTNEFVDSNERKCKKCGAKMVLRTAKHGNNAGNSFWGCSNYPNCRYIENL